jgi:hypothetical protein
MPTVMIVHHEVKPLSSACHCGVEKEEVMVAMAVVEVMAVMEDNISFLLLPTPSRFIV